MVVKMIDDRRSKGIALILSGILTLEMCLTGCTAMRDEQTDTQRETASTQAEADEGESAVSRSERKTGEDKTEIVYAKADAKGNVQEITVEEVLKNPGGDEEIQDYSTLYDIKNTEGDEEFTQQGNGMILWQNHGEDIHYEGKSREELPISVKVSYYLNGEEMEPARLAGQSGAVRIRFDYENLTSETVTVDGEEEKVQVPFAVFSALFLPEEQFSNVEVTNGKMVSIDSQNVIIGYAFPGLADSLRLEDYEPTEEVEIPDYVEVTADVTDFELAFTATVAATGIFDDIDLTDLDDADELVDDMSELTDASGELVEGTAELFDGMETFQSYMKEYLEGVSGVNQGMQALADGIKMLNEQKESLETGTAAIQTGLEGLNTALAQVSLPAAENAGGEVASAAMNALAADGAALETSLAATQEQLDQVKDFAGDAEAYVTEVQEVFQTAADALNAADLEAAEEQANETAKAQVREAADAVLEKLELAEEEREEIREELIDSIDVSGATSEAQDYITKAKEQLEQIPSLEVPDLTIDISGMSDTIDDMEAQFEILESYSGAVSGLIGNLSAMSSALAGLKDGVQQLYDGSQQLADGVEAFNQGIEQLYDGSVSLNSGTDALDTAGASMEEGLTALVDGTRELKEGFQTFDEEGIQSLGDLAGDDLKAIVRRLRAVKEADGSYNNFAGIREDQTGSVKFIIETEEIEKAQ